MMGNEYRQTNLDVLKGMCILAIVVTHFPWSAEERLKYLFPFWIDMAVPILMIISGYVYAYSYRRHMIIRLEDAYSLQRITNKIIRYTIPFAITYLIEEIVLYIMQDSWTDVYGMLAAFLNGGRGSGGYYYPIMIQFIFIYPFIYFIVQKYGRGGVLICGFTNFIYEVLKWAYGMNEGCYRLLIFRYILVIAFGCFLSSGTFKASRTICAVSTVFGMVFILITRYLNYIPPMIAYWTGTSCLACLFIIPISILLIKKLRMRCRLLEVIGKASFNIFLVQKIYYFCVECGYGYVFSESCMLQICANIFVCTTMGILFYYVETPFTKKAVIWTNMHLQGWPKDLKKKYRKV